MEEIAATVPIADLPDETVRRWFAAAELVEFYTFEPPVVRRMRRLLDELERRGIASPVMRTQMRDAYVQARLLGEASAYANRAGLAKLPTFHDDGGTARLSLWRVSTDGSSATRRAFRFRKGLEVIVVSSPWCHFTQDASAAIAADPALSAKMAKFSHWILPQVRIPTFSDLGQWNLHHPGWPIDVVDQQAAWTMIPGWATPGFYFFRDGELVRSVVGWPGPAQLGVLEEAFESRHQR